MSKLLADVVAEYELANEISEGYAYQLTYALRRMARYLCREPTTNDLNQNTFNRWLLHESRANEISARSQRNIRTSMLTIWDYHRDSNVDRRSIRSVSVPERNPEAWVFEEHEAVAEAALKLVGRFANGVPRSLYMHTCLWFAYETGLRRSDVWAFDIRQLNGQLIASFTQQKPDRVHTVMVSKQTMQGLRKICAILKQEGSEYAHQPLRWPIGKKQFYYWMKKCRTLADVDPDIRNRALQHIRRTGATQVGVDGGTPWKWLGHHAPGLDRKCYVDRRKTDSPVMPSPRQAG